MNFHLPNPLNFLRPKHYLAEVVAGIRDQVIEIGTHVRFLEADRLPPQPRDDAGRFVSKYEIRRKQMADACSKLTPEQREAAKARAMQGKAS